MTTFFLDLWQDLRAKRLWPVAVALVAATVAVPLLLFKPATSAPPATPAGQASNTSKLPTVALDASSVASSHLDVFGEKNPFNALSDPAADPNAPASGDGSGVSGNTTGAASTAGGTASSGGGSTLGGASGGGSSAPAGSDPKAIAPGVHYFTYTADVRFGPRSDMKTYKGVGHLDLLPDGNNPIIAFMGVKDGKTAMFFIADPAFRVDGEGTCDPSPDNCMFLSLRKDEAHNEATLSAQNGKVEYDLELTGLHIKDLDQSAAVGDTTPTKAKTRARRRASLLSLPALGVVKR
ncbi:MAG: hypothetical protein QOG41_677 [Thermoleophilaceae bacterium]|jgi:hypothetical protein|nr:hypothetical protein [Thermoleophilaceae bacterium]